MAIPFGQGDSLGNLGPISFEGGVNGSMSIGSYVINSSNSGELGPVCSASVSGGPEDQIVEMTSMTSYPNVELSIRGGAPVSISADGASVVVSGSGASFASASSSDLITLRVWAVSTYLGISPQQMIYCGKLTRTKQQWGTMASASHYALANVNVGGAGYMGGTVYELVSIN
jgi:hypothetical protein